MERSFLRIFTRDKKTLLRPVWYVPNEAWSSLIFQLGANPSLSIGHRAIIRRLDRKVVHCLMIQTVPQPILQTEIPGPPFTLLQSHGPDVALFAPLHRHHIGRSARGPEE